MSQPIEKRLYKFFQHRVQREQFILSMGEQPVIQASMKVVLNLLAHGLAGNSYYSPGYAIALSNAHKNLSEMLENVKKIPDHGRLYLYHFCVLTTSMIAMAIEAMAELHKEDNKGE